MVLTLPGLSVFAPRRKRLYVRLESWTTRGTEPSTRVNVTAAMSGASSYSGGRGVDVPSCPGGEPALRASVSGDAGTDGPAVTGATAVPSPTRLEGPFDSVVTLAGRNVASVGAGRAEAFVETGDSNIEIGSGTLGAGSASGGSGGTAGLSFY